MTDPANPYAPPTQPLERGSVEIDGDRNLPALRMSTQKLAILMVVTLGLYVLSWAWRNWSKLKSEGADVWIIPRTIFIPFTLGNLAERVHGHAESKGEALPSYIPVVFLVANIANNFTSRIGEGAIPLLVSLGTIGVSTWCLVQVQTWVNDLHSEVGSQARSEDSFGPWAVIACVAGVLVWGLTIVGLTMGDV